MDIADRQSALVGSWQKWIIMRGQPGGGGLLQMFIRQEAGCIHRIQAEDVLAAFDHLWRQQCLGESLGWT